MPVLYARSEMRFPGLAAKPAAAAGPSFEAMLAELRKGATEAAADRATAVEGIAAEAGIFVGRGAEFFTLELAARTQKVVLIEGPGGTGKTELAKGFARWWRDTGGTDDPELVFFHSFEPGLASFGLDGVLAAIGTAIVPSEFWPGQPGRAAAAAGQGAARARDAAGLGQLRVGLQHGRPGEPDPAARRGRAAEDRGLPRRGGGAGRQVGDPDHQPQRRGLARRHPPHEARRPRAARGGGVCPQAARRLSGRPRPADAGPRRLRGADGPGSTATRSA